MRPRLNVQSNGAHGRMVKVMIIWTRRVSGETVAGRCARSNCDRNNGKVVPGECNANQDSQLMKPLNFRSIFKCTTWLEVQRCVEIV